MDKTAPLRYNIKKKRELTMAKEGKKRSALRTIAIILGAIVFALLLTVFVFVNSKLNKLGELDDMTGELPEEIPEEELYEAEDSEVELGEDAVEYVPEDIIWAPDPSGADEILSGKVKNILLIGQDRRPGEGGRARSDAMILASMNSGTGKITLVSFMRDTYVQIPGHTDNRLNTAFRFGGADLLCDTLYKNFEITVDGVAMVDFRSFTEVIDAIGGVTVDLTAAEANYMTDVFEIPCRKGANRLDGEAALGYSRIRHVGGGDRGRTERQRNVIVAIVNEMKTMSLSEINETVDKVLGLVYTDMSNVQIMSYAVKALGMDLSDIASYSIPAPDTYRSARIRGMAVYVPDLEANRELLRQYLYGQGE